MVWAQFLFYKYFISIFGGSLQNFGWFYDYKFSRNLRVINEKTGLYILLFVDINDLPGYIRSFNDKNAYIILL